MGDGADITLSAERKLGDRIARELFRDPDYLEDPVLDEYLQNIWQPLVKGAQARGELSPELQERFAWRILISTSSIDPVVKTETPTAFRGGLLTNTLRRQRNRTIL